MTSTTTGGRATAAAPGSALERVPPHVYFVGSAVFHYLGPAFAVLLFARVDALGVAWLRIASAALVFAAWGRPRRRVGGRGRVPPDRRGRPRLRRVAPALAPGARAGPGDAAAAPGLGRAAGRDERL